MRTLVGEDFNEGRSRGMGYLLCNVNGYLS